MPNRWALAAIILSLISLCSPFFVGKSEGNPATVIAKETTYDRIVRTRTIRCAYVVWPPYLTRDMNTGALGGVYHDLLERLANDWAMKVEWTEEVGTANRFEGFKTGRYDLVCAPGSGTPERTAVAGFSKPIVYHPFYLYVRDGNVRFDNAYEKVNSNGVKMISIDGYIGSTISKELYPKANLVTLPNLSSDAEVFMGLAQSKADAAVCDSVMASDYIQNNPGKIKRVAGPPVRIAAESIAFPVGEMTLAAKINTSLEYYLDVGVIEKILTDNGLTSDKVLRVAHPYRDEH